MSDLAIHGGSRSISSDLPPMFPGGMRIGNQYLTLTFSGELEEKLVLEVLHSKKLFRYGGPPGSGPSKVDQLEREFAEAMRCKYAVAVSSGTAALMCALAALGVGHGDEVIIPAYTWYVVVVHWNGISDEQLILINQIN